jgi:hypothetical protein
MVGHKANSTEDAASNLRFHVTGVVGEEVAVDGEPGLLQVLHLRGVISDDRGHSGLAGKAVQATLRGDTDFPIRRELDQKHGVTEGQSIGEIGLDGRRGLFVYAYLQVAAIQAIASVARRSIASGVSAWMDIRYASSSIKRTGESKPNDLRLSSEKRAALLELRVVTWEITDDD